MLHQSNAAKLLTPVVHAPAAGITVTQVFEFTFDKAFTAASDLIEIGVIPAYHQVVAAEVIGEGLAGNTATIKAMTGEFGDTVDTTRVLDADAPALFTAADVASAAVSATTAGCLAIPHSAKDTPLGVQMAADVAAGSDKVTLVLTYIA